MFVVFGAAVGLSLVGAALAMLIWGAGDDWEISQVNNPSGSVNGLG
jgi:hypothetical protein